MGTTKADFENSVLVYRDGTSEERTLSAAPVRFDEDFIGYTLNTTIWQTVEVNLNTAISLLADTAHGICQLELDSDNNAEDAVLYFGDQRGINLKDDAVVEMRLALATIPTGTATVVWGVATDHNLAKDSVSAHAWFRLDGSGAVKVETDDNSTDDDDNGTGTTLTAGTYHIFRIDFADLTDVKFYINGSRVASTLTFDMSGLTDALAVVQPYISLDKDAETSVAKLYLDYVRAWSVRS